MLGVFCEVRPKFFYRSAPVKWLIMSFFLLWDVMKTEEKLDGRYKEGHERKKPK